MELDQPTTEEFIQHYTQKYSDLKKSLKFKETFNEVEPKLFCKALKFTSNLPEEFYSPAECVEDVESLAQKIQRKFDSEYGPDTNNERLQIIEFLYLVEKFLVKIFQNSLITKVRVRAARVRAAKKKKIQKILREKKN